MKIQIHTLKQKINLAHSRKGLPYSIEITQFLCFSNLFTEYSFCTPEDRQVRRRRPRADKIRRETPAHCAIRNLSNILSNYYVLMSMWKSYIAWRDNCALKTKLMTKWNKESQCCLTCEWLRSGRPWAVKRFGSWHLMVTSSTSWPSSLW